MNENPSLVPRRDGNGNGNKRGTRNGTPAAGRHNHNHHRHMVMTEDESGDLIKCTGKSCKSCTAGLIADCVAVCCCPCAVVNILVFAFLKVPWMVGRRILKLGKKKKGTARKLERKRQKCGEMTNNYLECSTDLDGISRKGRVVVEEGEGASSEFVFSSSGLGEVELKDSFCEMFEAEEVWFELHGQFGHLSFGRVSFTGVPSLCKSN
ncbi:hypothetical protein ACH5RR_011070 [Cinchona calisaya]|uniref:Transmembrane protein n=1 Tax=Cinchona calisaya TaxID=153742 RepID=A0ABD3A5A3_9GENT